MSSQCYSDLGIEISKQGLDKKFNSLAISFFKKVLERIIPRAIPSNTIKLKPGFNNLRIKDSTCFQLPEQMKSHFPGSGGDASEAAVRIMFEYDLATGSITELSIHPFKYQDISNAKDTLNSISSNDLVIRDLGFTCHQVVEGIIEKQGYFIARMPTIARVYELVNNEFILFDFGSLYKKLLKSGQQVWEKELFMGVNKIKVRVVVEVLPKQVIEERKRKANRRAIQSRRKLSKEKLSRLALNIFITNIPEDKLEKASIRQIYRLRWQIELIFKAWKSYGKLDSHKAMKPERYICCLYAKLILHVINWKFTNAILLKNYIVEGEKISVLKCLKSIIEPMKFIISTTAGIFGGDITHLIEKLILRLTRNCKYEGKEGKSDWFNQLTLLN